MSSPRGGIFKKIRPAIFGAIVQPKRLARILNKLDAAEVPKPSKRQRDKFHDTFLDMGAELKAPEEEDCLGNVEAS
jgi:hypothetical protein